VPDCICVAEPAGEVGRLEVGVLSLTIRGVYHSVSKKWLQGYLNEYACRYNHRHDPVAQFR
jgi:hypothetical protein